MSENGNSEKSSLFQASAPVFIGSVVLIFSVLAIVWFRDVDDTLAFVTSIQNFIVGKFGWFYVFAVAVFIVFALGVAMSSMGSIRLGPDDSEPDFSTFSWFSMLFSAGMGIGIMFYGVAEPIMHYANPPVGPGETVGAARQAMELAFFHWGLHAWAIYAVMGLSLAYFGFRQGLPLTVRSALYPIIGDRIHGWMGHVVDIFAVLGTMFGVATSLGIGVMQVNAGLSYLFGIPQDTTVQVILITVITLMATTSVVSGINAGIRRLSEINLLLAVLLMLFVLVMGPTVFLLTATVQNTGAYLSDIVNKTFTLYAYQPNEWIGNWTLFYWGWWISWSPFVGMFIARVSRGRTIREFVIGVLLVPSAFTFLWFTVFGNTALELQMAGAADIVSAVNADVAVALFKFLENLPFASISMGLATILVVTFFVTSSDSGSLVIDIITSGGQEEPPVWQRIFWALTEGVVAALLLLAGGLVALQTAAITTGFPLGIILLLVSYGLFLALRRETQRRDTLQSAHGVSAATAPAVPWRQRLGTLLNQPTKDRAVGFLKGTVVPALEDVAEEIRGRGLDAQVVTEDDGAMLTVAHGSEDEFHYGVTMKAMNIPSFAITELEGKKAESRKVWRVEVSLREGGQRYDIMGYTKEQVIADLLAQYERHMHYFHMHVVS